MGCTVLSAKYLVVLFLLLWFPLQGNCRKQNAMPSSVVVGTLYCNTCSEQRSNKLGHYISGASIEIECTYDSKHITFRKTAITNQKGLFKFNIPPEVDKNIQSIKNCSMNLLKTNHPTFCDAAASVAATSALELHINSTRKNGMNVYSAGSVTFKPQKQPAICDQKLGQPLFFFPPNPFQPPNIGGFPIPQNPLQPPPPSLLPPGFQPPPPSIIPPVPGLPFQPPPPPPSLLPPVPMLPPTPPFSFPPIPGLTPPPPPPPPPAFQFPPFLQPGFPGIPPGFPGFPSKKEDSP